MSEPVTTTLRALIDEHGLALLDHHRRVEALLRDLHPDRPRTVAIAIEALERGVVRTLREARMITAPELDALAASLRDQSGLSQRFALQAVELWLEALPVRRLLRSSEHRSRRDAPSAVSDRPGTLESQFIAALASDSRPPRSRRS